jgi:hypothetical protein
LERCLGACTFLNTLRVGLPVHAGECHALHHYTGSSILRQVDEGHSQDGMVYLELLYPRIGLRGRSLLLRIREPYFSYGIETSRVWPRFLYERTRYWYFRAIDSPK